MEALGLTRPELDDLAHVVSPYMMRKSSSAMSIPADAPAAVLILSERTNRPLVGMAPYCLRSSSNRSWLRDLTATPPPRGSASRCKRMSSRGLFREWPAPNQGRAGFRTRPRSRGRPARSGCLLRGRRQNRRRREAPSSRCHFGQDLWFRNEDDLVVGDLIQDFKWTHGI